MFPLKAFYWGQQGARDNYSLQIKNIIDTGHKVLGEMPTLIGECGIPMDMKYVLNDWMYLLTELIAASDKEALTSESWTWQYRMMDALMTALERSLASFTYER